jgi:NADPH:quinone reductase-like Zn-dependent oxidoreductase
MKEAIVAKGLKVTIQDVPIPEPQEDQVVIKVVVSGSNPKDWYVYNILEPNSFPVISLHKMCIRVKNND